MSKAKTEGFRWLPSYYEAIRDLPDAERLMMYDAISDFGFGNEVGDLPPLLNGYFGLIKPSLEGSIKFEVKQKANGQKGGRPRKPAENPKETQNRFGLEENSETQKPSENLAIAVAVDNAVDSAVENKASKPPRAPRFTPPSVEEVKAYCLERRNGVDAQRFVDFYEANGWTQGRGKTIKDWKAAVRTWEGRGDKPAQRDISSPDRYTYTREESL